MKVLVLGAARSGTAALHRAVAAAVQVAPVTMTAQFGLLHRAAQAMKAHAGAVAGLVPAAELGMDAVLSRCWQALLEEQGAGAEAGDRIIAAPDVLADCPNLRSAQIVLALDPAWQVIAIQRHPVGFVGSRLRAHPSTPFATHCSLWSNAARALGRLQALFAAQVHVVDHAALLAAPEDVAAGLASFLHLDEAARQILARSLSNRAAGRSAAFQRGAVHRPADTSWSAPEISLFRLLCEQPAAAAGYALDFAGVEENRPLDLVRAAAERAQVSGVWAAPSLDAHDATQLITCGDGAAGSLRLGPVSAGRRRHLRLLLVPQLSGGAGELQLDIVESLSRRPLLGRRLGLAHDEAVAIDTMLPDHAGLLDVIFSGRESRAPRGFQLRHASLSHA